MSKAIFFVSKVCLVYIFFVVFFATKTSAALVYPTMMAYSWTWPGDAVTVDGTSHGGWDMLGWQFENPVIWESVLKPRIKRDIQDLLWRHNNIAPGRGDIRTQRIAHVITIPAFLQSKERLEAIVNNFTQLAEEIDTPIIFKVAGYVWWDWEGCPACQNGTITNNDVEWWGWDSRYVWAKGSPTNFSDPNNKPYTWRDWGVPFKIYIPHPDFNSPKLRNLANEKIGILSKAIAGKLKYLEAKNKSYLIYAFIPENEVAYGWSFHPIEKAGSQYGVKNYIKEKCPNDVLQCLPPKPTNVSKEDWIKQQSDAMYRPADYGTYLLKGSASYLSFVSKIAFDNGIPLEKIIAQTGSVSKIQNGEIYTDLHVFDVALNNYSIPGYSTYGDDISNDRTLNSYRFLKSSNRNVGRLSVIESLYYGPTANWKTLYEKLYNTEFPKMHLIVLQNWESVLISLAGGDQNYAGGRDVVIDYLTNSTYPTCGNNTVENKEQCEYVNPAYKLPDERNLIIPAKYETCNFFPDYYSGKTTCSNACTINYSSCLKLGDLNLDNLLNIQDVSFFIKNLFSSTTNASMDMDKNGIYSLGDLILLLKKFN
ncbi:hypothetical protein KA001_03535 [Patescibacteria group bacterium]|nr:hypothetical protein [Patescibacteria group bacterium]